MLQRYFTTRWAGLSDTARSTFRCDLVRSTSAGALDSIGTSLALVVAMGLGATADQKSIIAGAPFVGLLLSMPYATWSPIIKRKTVRAALPALGTFLGLIVAALANGNTWCYTLGLTIFGICATLPLPIITGIYRDNYPGTSRGQLVGVFAMLSACFAILWQWVGKLVLDHYSLEAYTYLFPVLAAWSIVGAVAILRMPAKSDGETVAGNPLSCFSTVKDNPLFGYMLTAWFLFGMANLALVPQRFEYLGDPVAGLGLKPGQVVLIAGVVITVCRLVATPIWAHLFDHFNFIKVRIAITSLFLGHIYLLYNSSSIPVATFACALAGFAYGGGSVAWMLWVSKFSPPNETSRYMAVHTFLTGVRGTMGPAIGYVSVRYLGFQNTAWVALALIGTSVVMMWFVRNQATRQPVKAPEKT